MTEPGILIVLEGIDGSGTTTQAELLVRWLQAQGRSAVMSREPTAGPVGRLIRQALQRELRTEQGDELRLDFRTMALLFAADRSDHNRRLIEPNLARGTVVVSDRYTLSSLLYQSLTAPSGRDWLPWLRQINATARRPELTLVLDIPAETAAQRRAQRGEAAELYEVDELQQRLARGYADAHEILAGERVEHIDGGCDVATVSAAVQGAVTTLLHDRS